MKALAWYTIVLNVLVIIAFILFLTGVIEKPSFSTTEVIVWAVCLLPMIVFGVMSIRRYHD